VAKSKLYDILCFKGGTALKKFYFPNYRFSEDLDFTLLKKVSAEEIGETLQETYVLVAELSNIQLSLNNMEKRANTFTFFINFSGPLRANITRGELKTDITIDEKLIYQPTDRKLLREYDEYQDIPEDIRLKVYTLEEIFMEKCLSILNPSRNEPRDVYDLWYLASNRCCECEILAEQIKVKGEYKNMTSFNIQNVFDYKKRNYESLWQARLSNHIVDLPPFNKVYRELRRSLKPLNDCLA
jgi:predicted nucleotidyltransferase component of viral defense system